VAYTDGQVDRLRARLCAYRAQKGENGRMRPWKAVINDILMSEATQHEYPKDGELPEFKEEALRRFAAGTSVPSQDKLEDIYAFLVDKSFLFEEELTTGVWDYNVALSLRSLFGEAARGDDYSLNLAGAYRSEVEVEDNDFRGFARYDMNVAAVDGEAMLKLDQQCITRRYDQLPDEEFAKRYGDQGREQRGFGFPTDSGELTLFFKDGLTGRTDIYLVTDIMNGAAADWFQIAKINTGVAINNKQPTETASTLKLDKILYQAQPQDKAVEES
jgi:hypothetical protein